MPSPYDIDKPIGWQWGGPVSESPMTGWVHRRMAMAMQRLWVREMGTRHSYAGPSPDIAARASVTAYDTATDFVMEDSNGTYNPEFEFPWFMQKGYDEIDVRVIVALPEWRPSLKIRIQTHPLVSAVATTSGTYADNVVAHPAQYMTKWRRVYPFHQTFAYNCTIKPTLPADRRVAIRVQCALEQLGSDPLGLSFSYEPRLVGLRARDRISAIGE